MSFWSKVGDALKGAAGQAWDVLEEAKELAVEYRGKDDDFLRHKTRSGTASQKMAAAKVLKERGLVG